MGWSKKRKKELNILYYLLVNLIDLDNSPHFLQRAKVRIKEASKLFHDNINTGEKSFINFLIEEVNKGKSK